MSNVTQNFKIITPIKALGIALRSLLWAALLTLILTGGYRGKLEFSQVDTLGWLALLVTLILRNAQCHSLPDWASHLTAKAVSSFQIRPARWLIGLFCGQAALYFAIQWSKFYTFITNAYDMTYVEQAIWATAKFWPQGKLLASNLAVGGTYFGEHFAPVLALLSPLYWIIDTPAHLFWVQPLLIGSGLFWCYKLCRKRALEAPVVLGILTLYMIYQPLRMGAIFNFREDAFFIPLLFGTIWAIEINRKALFWIFALCCFFVKENAAMALIMIAVWSWARGYKREGIILCFASVFIFGFLNFYLSPLLAGGAQHAMISNRLSYMTTSSDDLARSLWQKPFALLSLSLGKVLQWKSLKYIGAVFLPFAPVLIQRPRRDSMLFMGALLLALANLLFTPGSVGLHYELILVPFLFAGLIFGMAPRESERARQIQYVLLLALCVFGRSPVLTLRESMPNADHIQLERYLRQIPSNASVITQTDLMPHLHRRKEIAVYSPIASLDADFVIFSFLKGMSFYATNGVAEAKQRLPQMGYTEFFSNPVMTIWCRSGVSCQKLKDFKK